MAAKIPFPYHPANKFHAGVKARFEVEAETPQSIDLLTEKVDSSSKGTQKAIGDVAKAIKGFPDGEQSKAFDRLTVAIEAIATTLKNQPNGDIIDKKLGEIGKAIDRLDETVQSLGLRDKDNVTALYAAAVDTSGDIVGRTIAGRWFNQAKFASLQEIVAFQKGKPLETRRNEFVRRVRDANTFSTGLPTVVTDSELARFFDLAPAVLNAIAASQDAASGEPPKA
ncbi:hypothetical protein MesoLj113a_66900 [Mesorhizobium sp. 113-1-2]|jgi:hypothetical protein|uniref:hypothetical protein n=1 Tax=Mesorhizobium sp. 113-1-2 TaxID=2744515 RepID=UPI0008198E94|nr:hypothetical protein [Mesorhizobium sp. 113-1-2]BAV50783.1 hypothetical protein MLTONO_5881 [Mesorhizobium loti]BCG75532.1 hypothetical protein MesoLj113a_66900 [Mesorhizobium sp. 113-1-2]